MKTTVHQSEIDYIEPNQPKWFKSYPYMIAIMSVLQVITVLYGIKMFKFFGLTVSVGWLITMPCVFYIFQIVSECYGWQYARQIVWCAFIVNAIFSIALFAFKFIPFAIDHKLDVQTGYINLLDNNVLYFAPTMWISMFFADFITSSLMSWSRFQWNGKFLLIRILILHCIAEIIILSGGFIAGSLTGVSISTIWYFSIDSFLARSIVMILLLPVVRYIIWFIQHKIEHVVVFDLKTHFNPFKFDIKLHDSVQFNTANWNKIDPKKIDLKKTATKFYSSHVVVNIKI